MFTKYFLLFALPHVALADEPAAPNIVSENVIVTASRFEEDSTRNTIGVQVISRTLIEQSGAQDLPTVLERQGGVYLRESFGSPNRQVDLRGFGVTGDQNTLVLLDGQRISEYELSPANLTSIPLSSVERIEIVRGSGAVLYGAGATAGVINIITRNPKSNAYGGRASAALGSYRTGSIGASGEVAGETLGASLARDRYQSDNYRANNRVVENRGSAALRWFVGAGDVTVRLSGSDQSLRLPGARTEAQLQTDRRGATTPNAFSKLLAGRATLAARQDTAMGEIAMDLAYRKRQSSSVQGGGTIDIDGNVRSASPRSRSTFNILGRENTLVIGFDWEHWDYKTTSIFGGSPSNAVSDQRTVAVYALDTLALSPELRTSLGVRWQKSRTELDDELNPPRLHQSRILKAYELALRGQMAPALAIYGRVGQSFRMPNVDENRFRSTLLEPQTSLDREIGLEFNTAGARLRAAVFQMRLRNEILFLPVDVVPATFFGANTNLPPTRREGLELESGWEPVAWLEISAKYTYTIAKFREGDFGGASVAGKTIPLVPRHRAGLSVTVLPLQGLRLSTAVSYVGSQYFDNDQSNSFGRQMPSYTLVDLGASYTQGNWTLRTNVRNLFGKEYFDYAILNSAKTSFNAYPTGKTSAFIGAEYRFK